MGNTKKQQQRSTTMKGVGELEGMLHEHYHATGAVICQRKIIAGSVLCEAKELLFNASSNSTLSESCLDTRFDFMQHRNNSNASQHDCFLPNPRLLLLRVLSPDEVSRLAELR